MRRAWTIRRAWMLLLPLAMTILVVRTYRPAPVQAPPDPFAGLLGPPGSPGARLTAAMKEAARSDLELDQALRAARGDAERRSAAQAQRRRQRDLAGRLLALAREAPADPTASTALSWVIARLPEAPEGRQAADLLVRGRVHRVPPSLCDQLADSGSDLAAEVLRAVAGAGSDHETRLSAELALASLLKTRAERDGWRDPAASRARADEARRLLEHIIATAGGLRTDRALLADLARAQLEESRTLRAGRIAPEIEGEDLDGRPMRLSEFRGRVVALTFWGFW